MEEERRRTDAIPYEQADEPLEEDEKMGELEGEYRSSLQCFGKSIVDLDLI